MTSLSNSREETPRRRRIVLQSPQLPEYTHEIDFVGTVGELKKRLQGEYPGSPLVHSQRIVARGRILQDTVSFADFDEDTVRVHLLVTPASEHTARARLALASKSLEADKDTRETVEDSREADEEKEAPKEEREVSVTNDEDSKLSEEAKVDNSAAVPPLGLRPAVEQPQATLSSRRVLDPIESNEREQIRRHCADKFARERLRELVGQHPTKTDAELRKQLQTEMAVFDRRFASFVASNASFEALARELFQTFGRLVEQEENNEENGQLENLVERENAENGRQRVRRMRLVLRFEMHQLWRAIIFLVLFGRGGSTTRWLFLTIFTVGWILWQAGLGDFVRQYRGLLNNNRAPEAESNSNVPSNQRRAETIRQRDASLFGRVELFIVGLVASLLPQWQAPVVPQHRPQQVDTDNNNNNNDDNNNNGNNDNNNNDNNNNDNGADEVDEADALFGIAERDLGPRGQPEREPMHLPVAG
ncbi:MAG: hypothetical protein MHM6MM_004680 [Cercozoa sp. M6MM]